ncbi:hypothetical protein DVB69_01955 [Sporosarcina sp. BI001-red]|uniref:hypothetical protein n=1 Tax=Sporosarcina sp. BI001-red TaxID=2282866 RepID=UPI000E26CA30|nr:hypothetical protein [Sporosarcina sp. BI001-red]REB09598.1 hypothetical protein DVB69_01955 [Sporosarcina sp. BI001-red]
MKNRKILYTALSASLLLAACGTDTSDEDSDKQPIENTDQATDPGTDGAEATDSDTEGTEATDSETEGAEDTEGTDEDATNEEEATNDSDSAADSSETDDTSALEGATETLSDEQDFKIQVLPTYKLVSEEPGRDILSHKEHDDKFMVIGTMQASETDFDKAVENMKETLAATGTDASPVELTDKTQLPTNKDLEKVQAYRVASTEGPITAMIFQKNDMIVRVMMYDNTDESYYKEFLNMAETIEAK